MNLFFLDKKLNSGKNEWNLNARIKLKFYIRRALIVSAIKVVGVNEYDKNIFIELVW